MKVYINDLDRPSNAQTGCTSKAIIMMPELLRVYATYCR
jgi:hypothetical protein